MSLLGVKYVLEAKNKTGEPGLTSEQRFPRPVFDAVWEDEEFRIWENSEALPRVFLVSDYLVINDRQQAFDLIFDQKFNLKSQLIFAQETGLRKKLDPDSDPGTAKIIQYQPEKILVN